jgi:hypothetical protein
MGLLSPNIDQRGRLWRALAGLAFTVAAALTASVSRVAAAFCAAAAVFVFFEAARGWCALRACGIKTRF